MTKNRFIQAGLVALLFFIAMSCEDRLDIGNPNAPTLAANVNNEAGILALATGGVYVNGFLNGDAWLGNSYFSLPMGYNELMADNVGASASNNQVTTIGQPDFIVLDNGEKKSNPSPSVGIIRTYNTRAATGAANNAIHYQWLNMYALNNACNLVLSRVEGIPFTGDADTKIKTIQAWCYWWKGYAYSSIGSKYISGLIVNDYGMKVSNYVSHDLVIAESNKYFNLAISTLDDITAMGPYEDILSRLIPAHNQVGLGGLPSTAEWVRNINTMLARNILFNKLAPFVNSNPAAVVTGSSMSGTMSAADWTAVKTLTTNGIQEGDIIFTGRTTGTNDFFTAVGGTVASLTANPAATSTFKISERVMQSFRPGDRRVANNFDQSSAYSNDYIYGTRYTLIDGGKSMTGVWTYADKEIGAYELVMAGSYEENALMLAEANIRLGDVTSALTLINDVRDYMGAGVTPLAGLSAVQAMTELTMERRTALLFRGLSYYDNRRWGWTYDIAKGGGSYKNVVVQGATVNTNVTINYNFMDYWDVPANESVLNPPDESSAPVKNPNF